MTFFQPTLVHLITMLIVELEQVFVSAIAVPYGGYQEQRWIHLDTFMRFCGEFNAKGQFFVVRVTDLHILHFLCMWKCILSFIKIIHMCK